MSLRALQWLSVVGLSASLLACSEAGVREPGDGEFVDGSSSGNGGGQSSGNNLGIGDTDSTNYGNRKKMTGVTYAPNGTLPLGNTLVYWSEVAPEPIPDGAYCDTCVDVPEGTSVFSNPDGTFELDVPVGAKIYIITQKGQFRRVREVEYTDSQSTLPADLTTLPGRSAGNNDSVPKIAIMTRETSDTFDVIWEALEKLGVREYTIVGNNGFTTDVNQLGQYHVVMLNCGSGNTPPSAAGAALQAYAHMGGKIYVSDYAYRYFHQTFPNVTTIKTDGSGWTAPGYFMDQALDEWMSATGGSNVQFEGNWTTMTPPAATVMTFPDGSTKEVVPKVWTEMNPSSGPSQRGRQTASFSVEYGCGRGMFSTFHAHASGPQLAPQEKALLYMLLEVSACVSGGGVH